MRHKKSVMRSLLMITQLGLSVMVPVFVCILAGVWIDKHAGTNLTIFLMFLGFLTGGWSGYKVAMTTLRMNEREEKEEERIAQQEQEARRVRSGENSPPVSKPKQPSRVRRHDDDTTL